jgi:methionyl-tRNA formyltransferase
VPIDPEETAGSLHDRLATLGADVMLRALGALERGRLACVLQSEDGVTYAAKIDKGETRIDWRRGAADLHNGIRGLSPYPGAWCEVPFGGAIERIRILKSRPAEGSGPAGAVLSTDPLVIACGTGAIQILEVQRAGKKPVAAAEFVRGARLPVDAVLR